MAKTQADPFIGTTVAGRFLIEERLGEGGMSVVYRARQEHVERPVAVKVLRPDRAQDEAASAQFLREARAVSQLTSPHTVTLIDVGTLEAGGWFLVMELLEGRTLRSLLDDGPIATDRAVRIADQIALALGEAHQRGIVHRDLKPLNVFLAHTPGHAQTVKVLDFGLATLSKDLSEASVGGTPRYMAPEAIAGNAVGARADVYALGLLLYEMLTGRHPFEGLRGDGLLDAHLSTPPPPLPATAALSPPLRQLIEQCLAKHPRLRPRDGAEFRERLRRAQGLPDDMPDESDVDRSLRETSPGHDTRATLPSTLSLAHLRARLQPERRGRMRWGAAAAAIAAGLWLWQRPTDPPLVAQPFVPPPPSLLDTSELPSEASSPSAAPREPAVDVLFHTIPDGAILRIDGHERGRTPQSISLPKGRVAKVELMLPGHVSRTLDLLPTENTRIRHVFVVAGTKPDPVNAKVDRYLD